jgi:hypothetical protein
MTLKKVSSSATAPILHARWTNQKLVSLPEMAETDAFGEKNNECV